MGCDMYTQSDESFQRQQRSIALQAELRDMPLADFAVADLLILVRACRYPMDFENSRLNSHELDYMEKRLAEIKGRV
jgi:uncharacterized protein (DUF924 family)